jgi:hypothetical protein
MSEKSDYQEKIGAIMAIPKDQVLSPSIPMDTYHQEAEYFVHTAEEDKDQLIPAGFPLELIEDTHKRIGASRIAHSRWRNEVKEWEKAEMEWKEKSSEAFAFRDKLVRDFDFAYRKRQDLQRIISEIRDGYGNDDMIEDVHRLGLLGKQHPEPLIAIGFDLSLLDKAIKLAGEMGELLANANGDRLSDHELKVIRNRAYTHLKEAVDEIKAYGKYVFWDDDHKLRQYSSAYLRRMNRRRDKPEEPEQMAGASEEN